MIRRADPERDNLALCALARRCPQGDRLRFYHERSDYRERLHLQTDAEVLLAEESGQVAAAVAVARKPLRIGGEWVPMGYIFDLMVDPSFRGRGLGRELIRACRAACADAQLFYCYILDDNRGSRRLFEAEGFTAFPRRLLYHTLLPSLVRRQPPSGFILEEPISAASAAVMDAALQSCYDFTDATAGHDGLFRLEEDGGRAWAALRRHGPKVFVGLPWHFRALGWLLPFVPRLGGPVLAWSLHHLSAEGPRGDGTLTRLLRAVAWQAGEHGISAITLPLFEDDPVTAQVRPLTLSRWRLSVATTWLYLAGEASAAVGAAARPLLASGRDG